MTEREITSWSAAETARHIRAGQVSSVEVVEALLRRIERLDPKIGAYLSYDADDALRQAREADARRSRGDAAPLLGVPIGIKDVLNVRGWPCTCGSKILNGYRSLYDATAISRLRSAGAVLLGRLNMDEFAMGSSTENSAWQLTRNPWDLGRVPGGSSGGSAAAVAADLAFAALGTDTGGSIRQPAALCGCVGLKPTYGRISRYGLVAYASSLDQIGPMTKTVEDAALLLDVMSGCDPRDSTTLNQPPTSFASNLRGDLKGLTLGLPAEYFIEGMDPEVESAVRAAVDQCRSLGASIVPVSLPQTKYAIATYYIVATAEASANLARFDGVRYGLRVDGEDPIDMTERTRAAGFGPEVKRRIILGTYVLSSGYYDAYYLRALKVRRWIRSGFDDAFRVCDALLTPTSPTPAFRFGERTGDPIRMYLSDIFTVTVNLAGICAISVPCGFTSERLPIGLQVIGPALREDVILRVAHAYEQSTPWHRQRPALGEAQEGAES
ncbi:MAG: Asp-tRNA(Asn)/Glu-tRNA(Gln) amidotransferase subunit GatA [Kiritimatiellae bacterium]|nr:Asp-tRNA(Asn)/Glu-tRNA(Gln) amidotransferase subunit GatA [Kiritimatiellia bacterium]MDW8459499.1 Asp-tRNA(Asn)/Glu-tRNA(Gln) amidotransferase subunit GatA [Verrucomicrobiota bacterium]